MIKQDMERNSNNSALYFFLSAMDKLVLHNFKCLLMLIMICIFLINGSENLYSQNPVEDNYRKAVQLMEESKWTEATSVLQTVVSDHGQNAMEYYGPAFGLIYYHLGLCQLSLKKYPDAARSFEKTYKEFPNKIPDNLKDKAPASRNHYHKVSIYRWGTAEQGAEEYAGALKLYEKFLADQPEKGTYSPAEVLINMGVCNAKLGKIPEATERLQKVYDNYDKIRTKEKWMLHNAFLDLAGQWIEKAMLGEGIAFMEKNDGPLRFSPYDSFQYGFNNKMLKLAQEASNGENNLDALALRFYTLIPRTEDALSELEDRKSFERSDNAKSKIQEKIDQLEGTISAGTSVDIQGLRLLAFIYEKNNNFRGAYSIYDYLSRAFPNAKTVDGKKNLHPEIVYQATRCAFSIGDLLSAQHHGMNFLNKYPGHELEPEVQSMLMEQLFRRGNYARCIEIATNILPKLPDNSPQQDLCLFCLGGSYYYDGQYEDADPILEQHATKYPTSGYLEESSYYRGANKVKLLEWTSALPLLEAWLTKYPESSLRSFAILDVATCHFANDSLDQCLAKLDEIEQRYSSSEIYDRSLNLRGDVLQAQTEWPAAQEAYLKGKSLAEQAGHFQVAAEALSQLVPVAIAQENFKDAATYYDEFIETYPGNFLEPQVVATALTALTHESVGRGEEGLLKLENMIDQLGRQENADLEKAVTKYGDVSVKLLGGEATIEKLKAMSTKGGQPEAVLAWLLVSRIDIIEKELKEKDPAKSQAEIKAAFSELRGFDKKVLAPYVLARIGVFLRDGNQIDQSVPWFNEIIERPGIESKDYAYNALAKIHLKALNASEQEKGLKYVDWVVNNSSNTQLQRESAYERASYYSRKNQWPNAEKHWTEFVKNKKWTGTFSAEAWYRLGESMEKNNKTSEALSPYTNLLAKYASRIEYSIPAVASSASIQKNLGKNAEAYKLAHRSGLKFANYLNDRRFSQEFATLKRIYYELSDEHASENDKDPFVN